jgi:hypothetical protein
MKKLLIILVVFLTFIFIGCDKQTTVNTAVEWNAEEKQEIADNIAALETLIATLTDYYLLESADALEAFVGELGNRIEFLEEENAKYAELLALLLEYWEDSGGIVSGEYAAEIGVVYTGTLTMDNYEDTYTFTLDEDDRLYFTITVDNELDLNIESPSDFDWIEFHESGTQNVLLGAGTYAFELENYYDYASVEYTFLITTTAP